MISNFSEHNPKALHYQVGSLKLILQRIQDTVTNMNEEVTGVHNFFRLKDLIFQHTISVFTLICLLCT